MAESEEELKSLLMKVKEESEKADLKLIIQKMKIIVSHPIPSCIGKTMETVKDYFFFFGSKTTTDGDRSHEIKRRLLFGRKVMSNLNSIFKSRDITFLPKSKRLLISWLQSPSVVILEPKKIKSVTVSIVSPSICHEVMGTDAMILVFRMLSFKSAFSLSSFTVIKRLFNSSSLSAIRVVSTAIVVSTVVDISPGNLELIGG